MTWARRLLFDLGLWSAGSEVSKAPLVDAAQERLHGSRGALLAALADVGSTLTTACGSSGGGNTILGIRGSRVCLFLRLCVKVYWRELLTKAHAQNASLVPDTQ